LYKNWKETAIYRRKNNILTIPKRRIIKIENNILNKKANVKRILKHIIKLLQGYLPMDREVKNGSSATQSRVQYMVLAVFGG
jgi:hypothetical protein